MKKNILYILLVFAVGTGSCKKDLEERFYNPDQLSEGVTDIVPGLFTRSITENKIFVQDYGEWYYLLSGGTSITGYAQIANRYITYRYDWFSTYNDLSTGNGFDDYPITGQGYLESSYRRLKSWEAIRNEVNARSGQEKLDADMYFKLVTLVKLYQTAKLVDLFNSVPYFDAFQGSNGSSEYWYPKYDDPKEIYRSVITDLGSVADSLPIAYNLMSPTGQQILANQDLVFKGDMDKWVQFANATRLKLLVRISGVDEEFARPLIAETLSNPLPEEDLDFPIWFDTDDRNSGFWLRGVYENTYATHIPNIIMKRMNYGDSTYDSGVDDPRLPVIAMPTMFNDYRGITYNIPEEEIRYARGERYYPYADNLESSLAQNAKSMYNHATYERNGNMPVYMFSRAELDLLLAEIALKGLGNTGKTADEHIKDAVIHSTDYWYHINGLSDYDVDPQMNADPEVLFPDKPSEAVIAAWGDVIKAKFTAAPSTDDKMEVLMQQKYIHLNLMHPYELWAELRRTGHPKLEPFTWRGEVWKPFPERVRYPGAEQTDNPTNFSEVSSQHNMTSKIFWVPPSREEVPYWDDYNYE